MNLYEGTYPIRNSLINFESIHLELRYSLAISPLLEFIISLYFRDA